MNLHIRELHDRSDLKAESLLRSSLAPSVISGSREVAWLNAKVVLDGENVMNVREIS